MCVRKVVGFILTIIGGLGALAGLALALAPLLQTYRANLTDPLGDSASKAEATLSKDMLRGAILGGAGVAIMLVGKGLWLAGKIAAMRSTAREDAPGRR
jgi:hypothetical protein